MKILQQISTHKAVKENGVINIYLKGLDLEDLHYDDELLWTIPLSDKDDLFAIFERLEENNRCNVAEFNTMKTVQELFSKIKANCTGYLYNDNDIQAIYQNLCRSYGPDKIHEGIEPFLSDCIQYEIELFFNNN